MVVPSRSSRSAEANKREKEHSAALPASTSSSRRFVRYHFKFISTLSLLHPCSLPLYLTLSPTIALSPTSALSLSLSLSHSLPHPHSGVLVHHCHRLTLSPSVPVREGLLRVNLSTQIKGMMMRTRKKKDEAGGSTEMTMKTKRIMMIMKRMANTLILQTGSAR